MDMRSGSTVVSWAGLTDIGLTRSMNQDCILAQSPLFIVADGMGGHAAGDVASRLAIDVFSELLELPSIGVRDLARAARIANERILGDVVASPDRRGMGTTITGFAIAESAFGAHAAILNVGDSRTYLWREQTLLRLTHDHSVVQELLDAGEIGEHEVTTHPHRHVVTRVLGADSEVDVDTWAMPLRTGDRLLVCSDGLSSVVPHGLVATTLANTPQAERTASRLIGLALDSGAPDNVSVIVVDIVDAPESGELDEDGDTMPG